MKTTAARKRKTNSNSHINQPFFSGTGKTAQNQRPFFAPVSSFALKDGTRLQAKLEVGAANSPAEKEADAVADQVMRMPEPEAIQRKCATCEEKEKIRQKPLAKTISKKSSGGSAPVSNSLNNRIQGARGGGRSMDRSTQNFMSNRFVSDFSRVNIHTGSDAVHMSRELNAQAFTVGDDVFFNRGKYNPSSNGGKKLLAHELAHVVQQTSNKKPVRIYRQEIGRNLVKVKTLKKYQLRLLQEVGWKGNIENDSISISTLTEINRILEIQKRIASNPKIRIYLFIERLVNKAYLTMGPYGQWQTVIPPDTQKFDSMPMHIVKQTAQSVLVQGLETFIPHVGFLIDGLTILDTNRKENLAKSLTTKRSNRTNADRERINTWKNEIRIEIVRRIAKYNRISFHQFLDFYYYAGRKLLSSYTKAQQPHWRNLYNKFNGYPHDTIRADR